MTSPDCCLTGRVFDDGRDPARPLQRPVNRLAHQPQADCFGYLLEVAARVEVQVAEPQLLASLHLVEKSLTRFGQTIRIRMPQVNQIAVVGQDLFRQKTRRGAGTLESRHSRLV